MPWKWLITVFRHTFFYFLLALFHCVTQLRIEQQTCQQRRIQWKNVYNLSMGITKGFQILSNLLVFRVEKLTFFWTTGFGFFLSFFVIRGPVKWYETMKAEALDKVENIYELHLMVVVNIKWIMFWLGAFTISSGLSARLINVEIKKNLNLREKKINIHLSFAQLNLKC